MERESKENVRDSFSLSPVIAATTSDICASSSDTHTHTEIACQIVMEPMIAAFSSLVLTSLGAMKDLATKASSSPLPLDLDLPIDPTMDLTEDLKNSRTPFDILLLSLGVSLRGLHQVLKTEEGREGGREGNEESLEARRNKAVLRALQCLSFFYTTAVPNRYR
jgi:hypothetical protein